MSLSTLGRLRRQRTLLTEAANLFRRLEEHEELVKELLGSDFPYPKLPAELQPESSLSGCSRRLEVSAGQLPE